MAIKKNTAQAEAKNLEIKVTRAKEINNSYAFDMEVNGIMIYSCWFKTFTKTDGTEFDTVQFPSYKGSDNKYYSYAWVKLSDAQINDIAEQISTML